MGMFAAVGSVYANMFNFSGRARRAEYWWYALFVFLVSLLLQGALVYWMFNQPEILAAPNAERAMQRLIKDYEDVIWQWSIYIGVASLFLYTIPQFAVTVRRLHDTGRSGWWMFKPILVGIVATVALVVLAGSTGSAASAPAAAALAAIVPVACSLWYLIVLCLPGTYGDNRFGPDPIQGRAPREAGHPALVKEMDEELGRRVAEQRRDEFQDYYRARVLPAIERNKARRAS